MQKRKLFTAGVLVLSLVLGLVLAGCDNPANDDTNNNGNNSGNSANPFTGYWSTKGIGESSGFQLNLYADADASTTGGNYALQVLPENTVVQSGSFTRSNNTATFTDAQGVPVGNGSISGSTLTLTIKTGTITQYNLKFTKL
jgi:hypothetical protein